MKYGTYDFEVPTGTYWSQQFTMAGYNLTDYTARFTVRNHYDKTILLALTKNNGITLANGSFTITITSAQATAMGIGEFVYDFEFTDTSSRPTSVMQGTITVSNRTNK